MAPWQADRIERWPIGKLQPSPRNSRKHPDKQIEQLATSLRTFGWTIPVLVDDTGVIIAGEGRYLAAKRLGLAEVPVLVARDWTEEQKDAYRETDNQLAQNSKWDDTLRTMALGRLADAGFDAAVIGIPDSDLKRLQGVEDSALIVQEVSTSIVYDEFWISIRGPLRHQADALSRLREAMKGFDGVSVDLGTMQFDTPRGA